MAHHQTLELITNNNRSLRHNRALRHTRVVEFKTNLQKSIRRLRKSKKLTQKQLGHIVGVDQATISNFECGKTVMTVDLAFELTLIFGVDFSIENNLSAIESPDDKRATHG
ncbi:helix-turn-helix transcriptional regulator [Pseudoalteromonas sp. Of7M-16]|uniref:helix-turn-helix transcriptional regulator n=1 Tax=Pseudoalteromonas sp. Of7M-16 TaxID=2917756 RepID=UPI001EF44ACB|nr:helix-turn-helix transcriptional regulator [Pseudoalteromonas sp. Of7M-16]MCG7547573.1 helix-turn-helix domain-containing protein [Pseudoalteromonas sp. Of7M-16]